MSKERLVNFIAKENGIPASEAEKAVEMVLGAIPLVVKRETDWRLTLQNFGVFRIIRKKATRKRDIHTGEMYDVPAKYAWDYNPAKALRQWTEDIPLTEGPPTEEEQAQ